jgi:hypothetical protein
MILLGSLRRLTGLEFLLGAKKRLHPGELVRDDGLGMFGDRLFVPIEWPRRLAKCALGPVESSEDREAPSLEESYPRCGAQVAGEGQAEREVAWVVGGDLGLQQLLEEDFAP